MNMKPEASLRLIGNLPADKVVALAPSLETAWSPAPWPRGAMASGPSPAVFVGDVPELLELPAGDVLQELTAIPAAVHGRLSAAGEEDRYRMKAAADTKLRCEVFAARLAAPIDSVVEIRRPDGGVFATNDDTTGTTDSLIDFTMPKDVDSIVVAVRDAHGRGGDAAIYRLLVTPIDAPPQDYQMSVERDAYNVVQGSRQVVRVRVDRQVYQGPIDLDFGQIPWGMTIDSAEIPAGASGKLITFAASADAPQCRLTSVRGRAARGTEFIPSQTEERNKFRSTTRTALAGTNSIARDQPWLAAELPISLAARGGVGFDVDGQPAADAKLVLGGKLITSVRCVRPAGYDGPVRLSLLTSQNPPQVNGVDDPNRTLRPEPNVPAEIPVDAQAIATWDTKLAADKVLADAQAAQAVAAKALADAQAAGGAALEAATKAKADADARVADSAPDKRTKAIEQLFRRPEFVDRWSLKWGDLLQNSRTNLNEPATYAFREWIRVAVATNRPLDDFVRTILTSCGGTADDPASAYFAVSKDTDDTLQRATQVFCGVRMLCAKCHPHPFENWTQTDYYGLHSFFNQLGVKADQRLCCRPCTLLTGRRSSAS